MMSQRNTPQLESPLFLQAVLGETLFCWGWISIPSMQNRRTQGLASQLKQNHRVWIQMILSETQIYPQTTVFLPFGEQRFSTKIIVSQSQPSMSPKNWVISLFQGGGECGFGAGFVWAPRAVKPKILVTNVSLFHNHLLQNLPEKWSVLVLWR